MADDARPVPAHTDDMDDMEAFQDALALKPGERRKFEERLKKADAKEAVKEKLAAEVRVISKLRPDHFEAVTEFNAHWRRIFQEIDKPRTLDPLIQEFKSGLATRNAAKKSTRAHHHAPRAACAGTTRIAIARLPFCATA